MCPLVLKALSDGTLVAGMHKNFLATLARSGNWAREEFHHSSGSSFGSRGGRDRYMFISIITFCSGLWVPDMKPLADAAGLSLVARVVMCFRIPVSVFFLACLATSSSSLTAGPAVSRGAPPGAAGNVKTKTKNHNHKLFVEIESVLYR